MHALRTALVRWYRKNRRDLPWRRTRDPYAIWVSEVMLQQTRVAVVVPYYERFLERFPDLGSLARASEETVLSLWSGLGYYGRARSLRLGAIAVLERHQGRIPADAAELRRLPGIGAYTAGAIASLAFGREEPLVDGNVRRVLARLRAERDPPDASLWRDARALVRGSRPGDLNQALMELGALVCTPREPRCDACPVAIRCRGRATGDPGAYPRKKARRAIESARVGVALVERAGRVLLERRVPSNPLRGHFELPAVVIEDGGSAGGALEAELLRRHGLRVGAGAERAELQHSILHRRLRLQVVACRLLGGGTRGRSDLLWLDPAHLQTTAVSGATRKVLRAVASRRPRAGTVAGAASARTRARGRAVARSGRTSPP